MPKTFRIATCASLLAALGLMLSLGSSLDSQASGGKGYHNNAAQIAIHKTCAGYNTLNPGFKWCYTSYPPADRFQKVISGGYWMP
jgi:hypothetical protein